MSIGLLGTWIAALLVAWLLGLWYGAVHGEREALLKEKERADRYIEDQRAAWWRAGHAQGWEGAAGWVARLFLEGRATAGKSSARIGHELRDEMLAHYLKHERLKDGTP